MKRIINRYLYIMGWIKEDGRIDGDEIAIDMVIIIGSTLVGIIVAYSWSV